MGYARLARSHLMVGDVRYQVTWRKAVSIRPGSFIRIPGARWTTRVESVKVGQDRSDLVFIKVEGRKNPLVQSPDHRMRVAEPPVG